MLIEYKLIFDNRKLPNGTAFYSDLKFYKYEDAEEYLINRGYIHLHSNTYSQQSNNLALARIQKFI